ncbi:MAG TPA: HD domain-containing phosphohydrolase [Terriglobia bacterium]|nr:HD domain-containing phosphohydrolase [Terriglobia bacterium]
MEESKFIGRMLVIDDEEAICNILCLKFTQEGFDCKSCLSGEAALVLLQSEKFDVIISDLRMPGISGLELVGRAREIDPRAAFLVVTGETDVKTGIEAMKQGAADYIVKPFQLQSVSRRVRRALEKRRIELELENYQKRLEEIVEERTGQLVQALWRIETNYDETLAALGAALDLRDSGTAGHSSRVTRYSILLAEEMGWSKELLRELTRGAYLHDIGKIGIPDGILLKRGKLSEEERMVMQAHVEIGYRLVNRIAFLAPAAEIVLSHQEQFDGQGYPRGLAGEQIPLGARIFAVADALDAMTSDRPYRKALGLAYAKKEIENQSGKQFDPAVVRVFLSLPDSVWEGIRTAHESDTDPPRTDFADYSDLNVRKVLMSPTMQEP